MDTLFVAFKGIKNTSFQLVRSIVGSTMLLTNSFQGLRKDIAAISAEHDCIYIFGIDKKLSGEVRVETCAEYNREFIETNFDTTWLADCLQNHGISCSISKTPTRYLCNAAYYSLLKLNPNTVLIHIPSAKGMDATLMTALITFLTDQR